MFGGIAVMCASIFASIVGLCVLLDRCASTVGDVGWYI